MRLHVIYVTSSDGVEYAFIYLCQEIETGIEIVTEFESREFPAAYA